MDLVKGELAWPVDKCETCDRDLTEVRPKTAEKANDEFDKLTWNDFCPRCGHGYKVGDRLVPAKPAEVLAQEEIDKVVPKTAPGHNINLEDIDPEHQVTPGEAATSKPSGIPPDERARTLPVGEGDTAPMAGAEPEAVDPENQLNQEEETPADEQPAQGEPKTPMENQYWCTRCASIHMKDSGIGQKHAVNAE